MQHDASDDPVRRERPVRVVQLEIPGAALSEQLLGPGIRIPRCEVIFRQMLPVPCAARLQAVQQHCLVIVFAAEGADAGQPTGLAVPWSQVSYIRFCHQGEEEHGPGAGP